MEKLYEFINANKWIKLFGGSIVCVAGIAYLNTLNIDERVAVKELIFLLTIPGAFALMGLLEIVSGTPFIEIASNWDELSSWKKGIIGIVVVVISLIASIYGIIFFA